MDSYEALLARADIDAVYIPLPTGVRKEWVLRAAQAGKHVLVEKPAGCNAADVREMTAACERHRVQFMDGVMFMHGRRLRRLRQALDHEAGRVRHIASQFSVMSGEDFRRTNIRAHGMLEPLGCLGDLGWYCLRFSLWAMNEAAPVQVTGCIHEETAPQPDSPSVPLAFSGSLTFPGGCSASFYCSFNAAVAQWAIVSGERALLQVPDFVLPFAGPLTTFRLSRSDFVLDRCRTDVPEGLHVETIDEPGSNAPGSQESAMFHTFSQLVLSGECDPRWPQMSLLTQRVLDACLQSAREGSRVVALPIE
jgi:predicted dehydrogenase